MYTVFMCVYMFLMNCNLDVPYVYGLFRCCEYFSNYQTLYCFYLFIFFIILFLYLFFFLFHTFLVAVYSSLNENFSVYYTNRKKRRKDSTELFHVFNFYLLFLCFYYYFLPIIFDKVFNTPKYYIIYMY